MMWICCLCSGRIGSMGVMAVPDVAPCQGNKLRATPAKPVAGIVGSQRKTGMMALIEVLRLAGEE
jgi:hypothetical protein